MDSLQRQVWGAGPGSAGRAESQLSRERVAVVGASVAWSPLLQQILSEILLSDCEWGLAT